MLKTILTINKLGYIEPSITEFAVKVEAGVAESNTSLEGIPEEGADSGF
ncbi:MAG: hypothetical protein II307_02010 [Alistipes sp.]|nr:hypothetical protein [Alistipes sp.]